MGVSPLKTPVDLHQIWHSSFLADLITRDNYSAIDLGVLIL